MQLTYQKLNENQMRNKKKQINCNIATTIIEQTLRKNRFDIGANQRY